MSSHSDGFIDAHVHVWTQDFAQYPLAAGWSPSSMKPGIFEPGDLFAHTKPAGVARVVLIQMVFYGFDNSYMLDCMEKHRGVFSGVALVDEHGPDPAGEMKRLHERGVRGVRIVPRAPADSDWLRGTGMRHMWQAAARLQMAICPLINPEDLPSVDRMCSAFPDTPVVIDHCCRIRSDGATSDAQVAALCRLGTRQQVHVKLSAFYFLDQSGPPYHAVLPMLGRIRDAYGAERLMWASDCPFQVEPPHRYDASLEVIRVSMPDLSESERDQILRGTAARVFFD